MRLQVNPNRMELLMLRRRLAMALRGHKLLKDKLEEFMRQFLATVRRLLDLQRETSVGLKRVFIAFALARGGTPGRDLDRLIPEGRLDLQVRQDRILNLSIPVFQVAEAEVSDYDLFNTEAELDVGLKKARELLPDLLEIARLWKTVEFLSSEIGITRRRVNALEHILIPNIEESIRHISDRLEEVERSYQVQLMRVKEIIRHHG